MNSEFTEYVPFQPAGFTHFAGIDFEGYLRNHTTTDPIVAEFCNMRKQAYKIMSEVWDKYGASRYYSDPVVNNELVLRLELCQKPLLKMIGDYLKTISPYPQPLALPLPPSVKEQPATTPFCEQFLPSTTEAQKAENNSHESQPRNGKVYHLEGEPIDSSILKKVSLAYVAFSQQGQLIAFSNDYSNLANYVTTLKRSDLSLFTWTWLD